MKPHPSPPHQKEEREKKKKREREGEREREREKEREGRSPKGAVREQVLYFICRIRHYAWMNERKNLTEIGS